MESMKYTVLAAKSQQAIERGYDAALGAFTLREARQQAKLYLEEGLGYAQIRRNSTDEVVADFFKK